MQLTPRYDGSPLLHLDDSVGNPIEPMVRQRRRLVAELGALDDAQWQSPSRCEDWSVQDVVSHLVGTNQFWTLSIGAGLAGTPTRFLATFDPVATPAQMVEQTRALKPSEVLEQFGASVDELAGAVEGLDPSKLSTIGEAPPGHVPLTAVLLHALWDAWIHERDILLPLGLSQPCEDDEVRGCLVYSAGLGPAFAAMSGSTREGTLVVEATDPDTTVVVEAGPTVTVRIGSPPAAEAARLTGAAADLVEAFSFRGPYPEPLGDEHAWLLGGLDAVFDRV
jgi:uncharacterized protein (TIGR03083 family)